jgi:hypothetical protein
MIIKLLPQQLVKYWDMFRLGVAETFVHRDKCTNEYLQYTLARLLSGRSQCWVALEGSLDSKVFIGFLITRITTEDATGEKVLAFDHVYAYNRVPEEIWRVGWATVEAFAKKNNCKSATSMTNNPRVLELARTFGFSEATYLTKEF